ncbi:hypothetical protein Tco_0959807, partial [Tanacetum coccineum]
MRFMMMGKVHHNSWLLGSLSFALMFALSPWLGTPKSERGKGGDRNQKTLSLEVKKVYEYLSDPDTKRKARDRMGYHGRSKKTRET